MNDRKKKLAQVVALILAGLMLFSTLIGGLATIVSAAEEEVIYYADGNPSVTGKIRKGSNVDITFNVTAALDAVAVEDIRSNDLKANIGLDSGYWEQRKIPALTIRYISETENFDANGKKLHKFKCTLYSLKYTSDQIYTELRINKVYSVEEARKVVFAGPIIIDLSTSDFHSSTGDSSSGGSTSTEDEEAYTYTSNVVFESASVTRGKTKVDAIDKDSKPFDLEVTFTDTGLRGAELESLRGADVTTFFVPGGSFATTGTTRGSIARVTNAGGHYPRFKATFSNLTYSGTGNEAGFQIYYLFDYLKDPVKGEGKAVVSEATPDEADKDEDKDKLGVAVPKMIIDSYSYGEDAIVAGGEFPLNFSVRNTSADVPLENVVITLTPSSNEAATKGPGLIVASSSNTIYLPALGAGASAPYSVAFQARPDAEVTSHIVQIKFSYEYVDTVKKSRESAEMTESIAIPVSQLDRFSVDPITDSAITELGREAYLTVNLANLGKSTTYNISLSIRCDNPAVTAPTERSDNLEAGAFESVDMLLTSTEAGEFTGDVVVKYEDDNGNEKELTTPFTLVVQEPWFPGDMNPPPGEEMEAPPPPAGPGALSVILCTIGGIAIAVPIALYLIKRVKAKASEDFDETI